MPRDAEAVREIKIGYAFKEWAVIVDALGRGEQSLILRKGGIQEASRAFRVDHDQFFLFPTFEHQNEEDLAAKASSRLEKIQSGVTQGASDIPIQFYAVLEDWIRVEHLGPLRAIKRFHAWSERAVEKRFQWGGKPGLYALVVRVFKLAAVFQLKPKNSYAGCKSWVSLEEDIPTRGSVPVLAPDRFEAVKSSIGRILQTKTS